MNNKNKKLILIASTSIVLTALILITLKQLYTNTETIELDYAVNYCINTKEKYLSEFNAINKNRVKVKVKYYHNNSLNGPDIPDHLKEFAEEVCDLKKYGKDNQMDYSYKCGDYNDIEEYTYMGTLEEVKTQFEDEGSSCYTLEKDENTQKIIENKKWCNYYRFKYYVVFNKDKALEKRWADTTEYDYSTNGNEIIMYDNFVKYKYTYNKERNTLDSEGSRDYLYECENEDTQYASVRVKYYYDGNLNSLAPNQYSDDYKLNHIECTNGLEATYDEERKMFFAKEDKKSECIVYFDNINNN